MAPFRKSVRDFIKMHSFLRFHLTPRIRTISVWLSLSSGGICFRAIELFETNFVSRNPHVFSQCFVSRTALQVLFFCCIRLDVVIYVKVLSDGFEGFWELLTVLFCLMVRNVYCARRRSVCSNDDSGELELLYLIVC